MLLVWFRESVPAEQLVQLALPARLYVLTGQPAMHRVVDPTQAKRMDVRMYLQNGVPRRAGCTVTVRARRAGGRQDMLSGCGTWSRFLASQQQRHGKGERKPSSARRAWYPCRKQRCRRCGSLRTRCERQGASRAGSTGRGALRPAQAERSQPWPLPRLPPYVCTRWRPLCRPCRSWPCTGCMWCCPPAAPSWRTCSPGTLREASNRRAARLRLMVTSSVFVGGTK